MRLEIPPSGSQATSSKHHSQAEGSSATGPRSWCCLVELFTVIFQHSLSVADIQRIDDLVLEHSALFDSVADYAGLKRPKHHFLSHVAQDAWRFGPPRGYWCFGFEGFNKIIKAGAQRSNWKSETVSIMRYWSMWSARWSAGLCV